VWGDVAAKGVMDDLFKKIDKTCSCTINANRTSLGGRWHAEGVHKIKSGMKLPSRHLIIVMH